MDSGSALRVALARIADELDWVRGGEKSRLSPRDLASATARMELCHLSWEDWGRAGLAGDRSLALDMLSLRSLLDTPSGMLRRLGNPGTGAQGDSFSRSQTYTWPGQHACSLRLGKKVWFYFHLIFIYKYVKHLHGSRVKSAKQGVQQHLASTLSLCPVNNHFICFMFYPSAIFNVRKYEYLPFLGK